MVRMESRVNQEVLVLTIKAKMWTTYLELTSLCLMLAAKLFAFSIPGESQV
jgi:hypothetical protein